MFSFPSYEWMEKQTRNLFFPFIVSLFDFLVFYFTMNEWMLFQWVPRGKYRKEIRVASGWWSRPNSVEFPNEISFPPPCFYFLFFISQWMIECFSGWGHSLFFPFMVYLFHFLVFYFTMNEWMLSQPGPGRETENQIRVPLCVLVCRVMDLVIRVIRVLCFGYSGYSGFWFWLFWFFGLLWFLWFFWLLWFFWFFWFVCTINPKNQIPETRITRITRITKSRNPNNPNNQITMTDKPE